MRHDLSIGLRPELLEIFARLFEFVVLIKEPVNLHAIALAREPVDPGGIVCAELPASEKHQDISGQSSVAEVAIGAVPVPFHECTVDTGWTNERGHWGDDCRRSKLAVRACKIEP